MSTTSSTTTSTTVTSTSTSTVSTVTTTTSPLRSNIAFFRFEEVNIPAGSVIDSCFVRFNAFKDRTKTPINVKCHLVYESNPASPTKYDDIANSPLTEGVEWEDILEWTDGVEYDTPDLSLELQEIVDFSGWALGNAITLFIVAQDPEGNTPRGASAIEYLEGSERAELHINWTVRKGYIPAPTFNPISGYYDAPYEVEISCAAPDVSIYYTTDRTIPNQNDILYSSPITIDSNDLVLIMAKAFKGESESGVAIGQFGDKVDLGDPFDGTDGDSASETRWLQSILCDGTEASIQGNKLRIRLAQCIGSSSSVQLRTRYSLYTDEDNLIDIQVDFDFTTWDTYSYLYGAFSITMGGPIPNANWARFQLTLNSSYQTMLAKVQTAYESSYKQEDWSSESKSGTWRITINNDGDITFYIDDSPFYTYNIFDLENDLDDISKCEVSIIGWKGAVYDQNDIYFDEYEVNSGLAEW